MRDSARAARTAATDRSSELASIVLGDAISRRGAAQAPERTPLPGGEFRPGGYDARSVLVLAIVVASLAAIVGWGMTLGRDDRVERTGGTGTSGATAAATASKDPGTAGSQGATAPAGTAATPGPTLGATPGETASAAPARANLTPRRISFTRSGSGGALLRIAVANSGAADAAAGAGVLVLLDGAVLTTGELGAISAEGATVTELELSPCPAGRHALVVVLDPQARLREASEADNATSRSITISC